MDVEVESMGSGSAEKIHDEGDVSAGGAKRDHDAGRLAIRRLLAGLAERDDPYAGADHGNAVRIVALIWILSGLLTLAMLPFDSPTDVGDVGWLLAGALIASEFAGGMLLRRRGDALSFNGLFAITYVGLAQTAAMQWLSGGWESPYSELLLLWVGSGAGIHPPRRALTMIIAAVAVAFLPAVYAGWDASGAERAATDALIFTTLGLIVITLMTYVRGQRVALRDEGDAAARLARVDQLTGLGNRRAFDEMLEVEIARARRSEAALSIALLDLDGFKALNDRIGHLEGDRCLRAVAGALDAVRRRGEQIFRWGGDEFAIILPGADDPQARAAVERISRLDPPIRASDGSQLDFCTGVAQLEPEMSAQELLERADLDLFDAKRAKERART